MAQHQEGWNETLHMVKRLTFVVVFIVCAVWNMFSTYRLMFMAAAIILLIVGTLSIHRLMAKRLLERDGFRIVKFQDYSRDKFVSWSYSWPWWCENFVYSGVLLAPSGDQIGFNIDFEGPLLAVVRPAVSYEVTFYDDRSPRALVRALRSLQKLRSLEKLNCYYSNLSNAALSQIATLHNLKYLNLGQTQVSDRALAQLKKLSRLQTLDLSHTEITDRGLKHLQDLHQLESLVLSGTLISDAGLEHLKNLKNLKMLYLIDTQVSNQGLAHLTEMSLSEIYLTESKATIEGQRELQNALPKCRVFPFAWDT